MRRILGFSILPLLAGLALFVPARSALAAGPRNPYSSFNLSGVNYGAQQWDRDQRAGRVVWPSYNVPSRGTARGGTVTVGGMGGSGASAAIVTSGADRPASRPLRRWRR
ncbi:MAG: hypothetical protein ACKOTB_00960 [Planctomycetia bacterium]